MPKYISLKKGGWSLALWSVIPAAFIGPGTVATCASAGSGFGLTLLWALLFSALATFALQEAAARITIASGKNLGEVIALKYRGRWAGLLKTLLFGAVALGCSAYQAGNILGAVSGLALLTEGQQSIWVIALGTVAALLLWQGNMRAITGVLAAIVFLMGVVFAVVALRTGTAPSAVLTNAITPKFPAGSGLIIVGLIGTTVVPYNLFLASGLSRGQQVGEMRLGIGLAVLIGGIISAAILLSGTLISGDFSFPSLAGALSGKLGTWASSFFGIGLFAAGASSSVTAPLAAAITGQALFGGENGQWSPRSLRFRAVWASVLFIGLGFGLSGIKPVPAIIAAQAVNGLLLPAVAVFLLLAVNDRQLLPARYANGPLRNTALIAVTAIAAMLGAYNIWRAFGG